jgi:hypothetical protein
MGKVILDGDLLEIALRRVFLADIDKPLRENDAVDLLQRSVGMAPDERLQLHHELDALTGTWSDEEAQAMETRPGAFEQTDPAHSCLRDDQPIEWIFMNTREPARLDDVRVLDFQQHRPDG